MKHDVKLERWSSWRNLERTTGINIRLSEKERNIIEGLAYLKHVRATDVIRGALIYAGVIPEPTKDESEATPSDDDAGTPCVQPDGAGTNESEVQS
mgnify:FL=1